MASWKKMAEAFGRAVNSPTATASGQELVNRSKAVKFGPEQRAYQKGYEEAERINAAVIDDLGEGLDDVERVGKYRDEVEDAYTDKRLRDYRKSKNEVARVNSDLWDRAFMTADEDSQAKAVWHLISEIRAKGVAESDILNTLRTLGK